MLCLLVEASLYTNELKDAAFCLDKYCDQFHAKQLNYSTKKLFVLKNIISIYIYEIYRAQVNIVN